MNKNKFRFQLPSISIIRRMILYIATITTTIITLLQVNQLLFPQAASYVLYVFAGILLVLSVCYLRIDIINLWKRIIVTADNHPFFQRLHQDYRYRTLLLTGISFLLNILFAGYNAVIGYLNWSAWFCVLAVYYVMLSIMRFLVLRYERNLSKKSALKQKAGENYIRRNCGILLLIMTIALGVIVTLISTKEGGKEYPGYLIYVVALYTFYKIIISIVQMVKVSKMGSHLLGTVRNIGYADALVSILSLQTAMFVSFDDGTGIDVRFNLITGITVCLMIVIMGIWMIVTARKE